MEVAETREYVIYATLSANETMVTFQEDLGFS